MAHSGANPSNHTPSDHSCLDGLPAWQLMAFRDYMFTPTYITSNANRLLDHEWIEIPTLKQFTAFRAPVGTVCLQWFTSVYVGRPQ
ncbi:hypothetical protein B0H10DRAFT_1076567 [Mycena sp. CBHHK59/15]|nr:hypothetical protein B0H10DRAFT_1076567 [Mycena sp. CBHHK59/15]